jgi:hypothetical protein
MGSQSSDVTMIPSPSAAAPAPAISRRHFYIGVSVLM